MDDKRFWDIIHAACLPDDDMDDWDEKLADELRHLDPEDLVRFSHWLSQKANAADRSDLVAAYNTLRWAVSHDGYYYFRCWLVGMGKRFYESTLADPDTLADVGLRCDPVESSIGDSV